jgi:predicted glycosyltransferase
MTEHPCSASPSTFPAADKQKLLTLVQAQQNSNNDDEAAALGAPAVSVYKTHSGGILDVLEDMKEKAEEQLASLPKADATEKAWNFRPATVRKYKTKRDG